MSKFWPLLLLFMLATAPIVPAFSQTIVDADAEDWDDWGDGEDSDDGEEWEDWGDDDTSTGSRQFRSDDELDRLEEYDEFGRGEVVDTGLNERVRGFDISGIMLGQDLEKVREIMKDKRAYRLTDTKHNIPEYFTFNYDAQCRDRNLVLPDAIKNCIEGLAKSDKMRYVSELVYKNAATNEIITVHFTSPATFNKVWKIVYENDVNRRMGTSKNFQYQRDERRRAFWYNLTIKYGKPNVDDNRWVLDPKDEFPTQLVAEWGRMELSNQKQFLHDIDEGIKDARRKFKVPEFTF